MTTALAVAPVALGAGPIIPPGTEVFSGNLNPVPHAGIADGGSNVKGSVSIIKTDTTVRVTIVARGLELGLSHLQNIAGIGLSQCPPASADTSGDGLIALDEALAFTGPLVLPLTLARNPMLFPTAGQTLGIRPPGLSGPGADPPTTGVVLYKRVFVIGQDIPIEVANALEDYQVVIHGVDVDQSGVFEMGEETIPAACGTLSEVTGANAWHAMMLDRLGRYPPPASPTPPLVPTAPTGPGRP
jgi:hypothetical protein